MHGQNVVVEYVECRRLVVPTSSIFLFLYLSIASTTLSMINIQYMQYNGTYSETEEVKITSLITSPIFDILKPSVSNLN